MQLLSRENFYDSINESLLSDIKDKFKRFPNFIKYIKYVVFDYQTMSFDNFYKKYESIFSKYIKKEDLKTELIVDINESKFKRFFKIFKVFIGLFTIIVLGSGSATLGYLSSNSFKERVAKNVEPFGYGNFEQKIQSFISQDEQYAESKFDSLTTVEKFRIDTFRKYLGLEELGNSIIKSEYKPSKAKDSSAEYFTYKGVRESVMNGLQGITGSTDANEIWEGIKEYKKNHKGHAAVATVEDLFGNATIDAGYDEVKKQRYISIADVWDLDVMSLSSLGKSLDIDLSWANLDNLVGQKIEFYDRIYIDNDTNTNKGNVEEIADAFNYTFTAAQETKDTDFMSMLKNYSDDQTSGGGVKKLITFTIKELCKLF